MSEFRHPIATALLAGSALVGGVSLAAGVIHEVRIEDRAFSIEFGGNEIWFDKTRAISAITAVGTLVIASGAVIYMHDDKKRARPDNDGQTNR
jgi:hypothetical protein